MFTSTDNVCTSSICKDSVVPLACFSGVIIVLVHCFQACVHSKHITNLLYIVYYCYICLSAQVGCVGDGKSNMEEFDVSEVIKEQNRVSCSTLIILQQLFCLHSHYSASGSVSTATAVCCM
jgi:hypothetical protein